MAYTALFAFGDSLSDAGNDWIVDGHTDPVPPYYQGHAGIRRELATQNPAAYRPDLAETLINLGNVYYDTNRFADAATGSGSANWKIVLGAVKPGEQASAKLPQGSDCHVDLHGTFADGQSMDASGIDVCAEKTLNLTD